LYAFSVVVGLMTGYIDIMMIISKISYKMGFMSKVI